VYGAHSETWKNAMALKLQRWIRVNTAVAGVLAAGNANDHRRTRLPPPPWCPLGVYQPGWTLESGTNWGRQGVPGGWLGRWVSF